MRKYIGLIAEDQVTGFVGEVTAAAIYKTGSDRVMVESMDDTGRPIEWWFDVDRLKFKEELQEI